MERDVEMTELVEAVRGQERTVVGGQWSGVRGRITA